MKLVTGQTAIDFSAIDINGKTVRLSDYKGQKVILSFYRNVSCPFCNRRVHQLTTIGSRFKDASVQLLFLFESSNEIIISSSFHKGITPWPIIGDPQKRVYTMYGIENSVIKMMKTMFVSNPMKAMKDTKELNLPTDKDASQTLIPADFFINENFKIVKAHYGSHIDDHVPIEEMKAFARIKSAFDKL